jgi:uncharacterized protein (TIGR02757 family)
LKIRQFEDLKSFLDLKYDQYNRSEFIESDPIQVPHLFAMPEDIEIAGFLTATLAWGQRKTIINKSMELLKLMDNSPLHFIMEAGGTDFARFERFCHRTFNATDTLYFMHALKNIYTLHGGLRMVFEKGFKVGKGAEAVIANFRDVFFETGYPARTRKHVPTDNYPQSVTTYSINYPQSVTFMIIFASQTNSIN